MTNELEKTFFDTFGLEPITQAVWDSTETQWKNFESWEEYPQISDRILLELICIVLNTFQTFEVYRIMDIDSLKEKILKLLILAQGDVYSQVRTLFEEG